MQDPKDPKHVTCDVESCGKQIHPMDRHVHWQTASLYSGRIGMGIYICPHCLVEKFGIDKEVLHGR